MDIKEQIAKYKNFASIKKNKYLHSENHTLADELMNQLNDKEHFGLYLKFAEKYPHAWLRQIARNVTEQKKVKTPGKLFTYLVKSEREKLKELDK